jgi:hypothetical protein
VGEGLGEAGLGEAGLGEAGLGEAGLVGEGFGEGVDWLDFLRPTKAS